MNQPLFIIVLRYLVDIKIIDELRPEHLIFLDKYYEKGIFLASGAQTPRTGGVIIAKGNNRNELIELLKEDPFYEKNCAEYQVFEFIPNKYAKTFEPCLKQ